VRVLRRNMPACNFTACFSDSFRLCVILERSEESLILPSHLSATPLYQGEAASAPRVRLELQIPLAPRDSARVQLPECESLLME
jgi:hypothetical protein